MPTHPHGASRHRLASLLAIALACSVVAAPSARAQTSDAIGLGTADNFAVLAGQGVTNTGPTTVTGDLGTSPNPAVTGAGLTVLDGTIHAADAVAAQAQADLVVAYDDAAGRPANEVATELGGQVLTAGAYDSASGTFEITGTLTLDAEGDPGAVFVFQAASTLVTATASTVSIVNGGSACNVFWQVGSSATLGTFSTFRGTILALASISVTTGATVDGRTLARNGSVTLDSDTITRAGCVTPETTTTTVASSANPSASGDTTTLSATVVGSDGGSPTGFVTFLDGDTPIGTSPLDSGVAVLPTDGLDVGDHTITAVYLGAPGFDSSTSLALTQVVTAPSQGPGTTVPATTATTQGVTGASPTATTLSNRAASSGLPATGAGVAATGAIGLLLVAAGAALVRTRQRRDAR